MFRSRVSHGSLTTLRLACKLIYFLSLFRLLEKGQYCRSQTSFSEWGRFLLAGGGGGRGGGYFRNFMTGGGVRAETRRHPLFI